ncbi:MAG: hypothetical protein KJN97_10250 [Deltaproteobacteria bacterium]|nr:hypothetical protein [Deltaproteobacteria bacterium]
MRLAAPTSLLFALAALFSLLVGCSTTPSKPSLMANMAQQDVTVAQLRAMDYEYAAHFGQLVSTSVLDIVEASDQLEVFDYAYQWQMWAAGQARAASFDRDPFAGMLELWALAGQQRAHFTDGGGKDAFAGQQAIAIRTSERLEREVRELASTVMEPAAFETLSTKVDAWIDEHPIEGRLFVRPTARAHLAALVPPAKQGGLKAVGSIEDTFRDLNDRLAILTVQLPSEARWHAEYLTNSLFEERLEAPVDDLVVTMGNINDFLDQFQGTVDGQVSTLLGAVEDERIAVFEAIADERAMVLTAIEQERVSVMDKLDSQLLTATTSLNDVGKGLIDHFFVRLIEVLAVVGVVTILTVLLVLVVLRKRRSSDD